MASKQELEDFAMQVLSRYDCDLVKLTFRREHAGRVLRLLIERKGADPDEGSGVNLKLCSSVSRDLSALFDVEDIIDGKFVLEVSSPGIERPLVKLKDFVRFSSKRVSIKTREAVEGRRRFKGVLLGVDDDIVQIDLGAEGQVAVPFDKIENAKLVFEPKG